MNGKDGKCGWKTDVGHFGDNGKKKKLFLTAKAYTRLLQSFDTFDERLSVGER